MVALKVVVARPPNFAAYGDTIFNPDNEPLSEALMAHEGVHAARQGRDPVAWWDRYIIDPAFRLGEELPAHQAEWRVIALTKARQERRAMIKIIAKRLSGPMYAHMITFEKARQLITDGVE